MKHTNKTSQVSAQNIPEHSQSLPAHTGLVVFAFSEIKIPPDVINYPLHVIKLLLLRQQTHAHTIFSDAARELRGNFSYFQL